MPVYKYKSYDEYRNVQIEGNKKKLSFVWAKRPDIKMLSDYIKEKVPNAKFGLCHGTRRGCEQAWFREFLGIEVIGTEISPTAKQFPHTIEWDFHDVKPEWVDGVDFIYSNAIDHSCKPKACLNAWMSCLKWDGVCILEWSIGKIPVLRLDPYGATYDQFMMMIEEKYRVETVLKSVSKNDHKICFFIVRHK